MKTAYTILILFSAITGAQDLKEKADQLFKAEQFEEAAHVYEEIVAKDEENYSAWMRLAQSYIKIKNGEKAVDAMIKVSEGQQIPRPLVHYLQAQAYLIRKDKDNMWTELMLAASTGFGNLQSLESDIWDEVREEKKFSEFSQKVDKTARPCKYDEKHNEFDFWLGDWNVYTNIEGTSPIAGTNSIEKQQGHCMISENWISATGNPGYSSNYYDGTIGQWVQHWVSSSGTVINLKGGLENGSMVLTGEIFYKGGQTPAVRKLKGTWTPKERGVVRQFFEESVDDGKTWYPWFEGFYFPKATDTESSSD